MPSVQPVDPPAPRSSPLVEVAISALRLGLTSFGGPIAHIGYFRTEYVVRRSWLDDATFGELAGLCQALPGPASSQLGIAIGWRRAGTLGGLIAWLGFTLPSAVALVALALIARERPIPAGLTHGLSLAAVAIVAQAVVTMARRLTPDAMRRLMAIGGAIVALAVSTPFTQLALIVAGALIGRLVLRERVNAEATPSGIEASGRAAPTEASGRAAPTEASGRAAGVPIRPVVALAVLGGLLIGLPLARGAGGSHVIALTDAFFRTGALVFGGGHVVLPLLHAAVVDPGWVDQTAFLAGYGAAQAVPGPLFSFAAYLGAIETPSPSGLVGAVIALVAIYLPSFLLLAAALSTWDRLRSRLAAPLAGINAAVVGILAAALVDPLWTGGVHGIADAVTVAGGVALLMVGKVPPLIVVGLSVAVGLALGG